MEANVPVPFCKVPRDEVVALLKLHTKRTKRLHLYSSVSPSSLFYRQVDKNRPFPPSAPSFHTTKLYGITNRFLFAREACSGYAYLYIPELHHCRRSSAAKAWSFSNCVISLSFNPFTVMNGLNGCSNIPNWISPRKYSEQPSVRNYSTQLCVSLRSGRTYPTATNLPQGAHRFQYASFYYCWLR